jgi:SAM-dependent methyltransferase
MCGPSLLVKLRNDAVGIRCIRCGGSAIHMSIAQTLAEALPDFASRRVYELSSGGAFFEYLRRRCRHLTCSEYFDDVPLGEFRNGIQCQDVERLTYEASSFDLCTSTEVFEHVPDDLRGFRELFRVLRAGGLLLLTVPLADGGRTVERARRLDDGKVQYLLPPAYHGDRIRGKGEVLCYRDYGLDIVERLRASGFSKARLVSLGKHRWWGLARRVVLAVK